MYLNYPLLQEESPFEGSAKFPEPDAGAGAPEKVRLLTLRANVRLTKDDYDGAILLLKEAVALSPKDFPTVRMGLAGVYTRLKRLNEAEALYREAASCAPDSIELAEALAHLLDQRGKSEEAIKLTDRAMELERIFQRP